MSELLMYALSNAYSEHGLITRDGNGTSTNSTSSIKPGNLHGALGNWAVVCYGINISSIVCSGLVILSTILIAFHNRHLLTRPSLRISTSIAVCDLAYSICQMFIFNNAYMSKLSEIHLRAFLWIMSGFSLSFVLLSTCMGIQLLLTVLTHKGHWANVIQPWYEVGSFFCAFLITHPYMYLFKSVQWIPSAQLFYLNDKLSVSRRNVWVIQWMWVFTGIIFLFGIAVFTYLKMSQVWRATSTSQGTPEKLDLLDSNTMNAMTDERKRYIRSVTFRVTCYPVIPIVTQLMLVVGNLMESPPYWLYVVSNVMPSTQGILNFLVYMMNPALDIYRKKFIKRLLGIKQKTREKFGRLEDSDSEELFPTITQPSSLYSTTPKDHHFNFNA
ncbi:hypothetical protein GGI15_004422 [Coemansia interrupta]|uniref:Uncharacterized protein n=1 Tax=Coemansia interrupta TaxID=1126814 RepID=A0A9W8H692_9FUNG|nr:hypothetical protein GGI15_004422 [Coemansia interrupta]